MRPWDHKRGTIMTKLKSCTCWVGDPQTGWQLYHGSSYSVVKVLSPTSGFWACRSSKGTRNSRGIWLWRPAGFDCRTSTVPGETKTPLLEGNFPHKILCALGHTGKEQWPHGRLNLTYLLVPEGVLQRQGVVVARHGDKGTGRSSSRKYPLVWVLLEIAISPTTEPIDSKARLPQDKQLTGRGHSPTYQKISGLKFYWAQLCTPEQDRILPTASLSHQEACTSLLHSLTSNRGQTIEARGTIILQPPE